jgi:hypothetical protein
MCCIPAVLHVRIVDMRLRRLRSAWLGRGLALGSSEAHDQPEYAFGTTVVDSFGFAGRVYQLKPGTRMLPKFACIYTTSLNVWPQNFDEGFPNITDRFEWFAIEYTGKFWLENPGRYRFSFVGRRRSQALSEPATSH